MKYLKIFLLLPGLLFAQPEFFGYFESEAATMQLGDKNYSYGYNKFRLDVEARPSDNVLIGANVNIQKYWGETKWNIYDFLPGYADSGLEYYENLADTLLIDNVYMRVSFPRADLTVGRQQISPGVGYAWNPTDIFNSKSLLDPSYEQTGVSAIRLDAPLWGRTSLNAVIQPDENWENSTKQVWLKSGAGRFDFDISVAEIQQTTPTSTIFGEAFDCTRSLVGVSLVGEVLGWGLWLETAQNTLDDYFHYSVYTPPSVPLVVEDENYLEYVVGVDHTFDNSLYLLAEALHNGFGVQDKGDIEIHDYFYALSGEGHSLMQDYAFFYLMHPTFDYVTLSAITFANLNDNSGTFSPIVDWNIFEDTNISLQGSFSWGEDDTEFGLQDWGLIFDITSNF